MKQGMSVNELAREVDKLSHMKRDFVVDTRQVAVNVYKNRMRLVFSDATFDVTPHAMSQIQQRLKIPADYFNRLHGAHPQLLADNIEYLFEHEPETRMFRGISVPGNTPVVRAVLSNSFKRIDNEHILRAAMPIFRKYPELEFQSTALTPLRMHVKVTQPVSRVEVKVGDIVEIGVGIANSEVGLGQVDVYPFVHRLVCKNGARINVAGMQKRHLGRAIEETGELGVAYKDDTLAADDKLLSLTIRDTIEHILEGTLLDSVVGGMRAAMDNTIDGSPVAAVKELGKAYALTSAEGDMIMQHLIRGGDLSQYGLVNAVTAASQSMSIDYDRATEFEAIGGKLLELNSKEWEKTYAHAAA
jgi:hypothetical protein